MNTGKKISIIIPVYKVERFIHTCVDSVLHQNYSNLEIILVDDGSPDKCPEICDQYAKEDIRIHVIHQKNQGLSGARNSGTEIATGEYILYLDSDDFLDRDCCSRMMEQALNNNADIVVGEIQMVDESGANLHQNDFKMCTHQVLKREEAIKRLINPNDIPGYAWGKLYKRSIVSNIEFPLGKVYEDRYTVPKYFDRAEKVCLCPGAITYYRMTGNSITHQVKAHNLYDLLDAEEWLTGFCLKKYPNLADRMASVYFGRHIYIWMKLYDSKQADEIKYLVKRMKSVYKKYSQGNQIKLVHKLSYKMIFTMPAIYRKLAHWAHIDT